MVTTVTNLGRSGVSDWIIQRVSAVVLTAYSIFIVVFLATSGDLTFDIWSALFKDLWVRIFSLSALLSIAAHSWIGLWSVLTDYVTERLIGPKALALRAIALSLYAIVTLAYLVWGIEILWGIK